MSTSLDVTGLEEVQTAAVVDPGAANDLAGGSIRGGEALSNHTYNPSTNFQHTVVTTPAERRVSLPPSFHF